jgi:hypothetical protein
LAFFSKTNEMIKFLQKVAVVWAKTPFSANIGPWPPWKMTKMCSQKMRFIFPSFLVHDFA